MNMKLYEFVPSSQSLNAIIKAMKVNLELEKPEIIIYPEYSKEELAVKEFNSFGFYLTNHPVQGKRKNNHPRPKTFRI